MESQAVARRDRKSATGLSEEQTTDLQKLQEFVNCPDSEKCLNLLKKHNWNLNNAISAYLEENKEVSVNDSSDSAPHSLFKFALSGIKELFYKIKSIFIHDSSRQVINTVQNFESVYKNQAHPKFGQITFVKACEKAFSDRKLLFMYIHDFNCKDSDDFCKNVFSKNAITEYLSYNFVSWMANVHDKDAKFVRSQMHFRKTPFFLIVSVSRSFTWHKVFEHEGVIGEAPLFTALVDSHSHFQHALSISDIKTEVIREEKTLLQQQDEDYHRAVQEDIEKIKRQKTEERLRIEQIKIQEGNMKRKSELLENLRKTFAINEPAPDSKGSIAFIIALPDGRSLPRRFYETERIETLYLFVETAEPKGKAGEPLQNFVIVSVFPRRTYERTAKQSLKDLGFAERAKIIVEAVQ